MSAVERARYPLLVSADMDLSVDLSFVPAALELLETHDIVVGSKKLGHQKRAWLRRFGSEFFLRIARLLLGIVYDDYSIAAKAYRNGALKLDELISREIKLDAINDAFEAMKTGEVARSVVVY